jgi:nucleotide-binding universal stress UspA family protein
LLPLNTGILGARRPSEGTGDQHTVLLATDGSLAASWPEAWILGLTWRIAPSVDVLCVADSAATLPGWLEQPDDPQVGLMLEDLREEQLAEASSIADGAAARMRDAGFASVTTTSYGEPAVELLARVREMRPTLVALGCRGRSEVEPMLLGSVSSQVARYTTAPALVARQGANLGQALPQRIVVVVDAATRARSAIDWLDRHGWLQRSHVTLLGLLGSVAAPMREDRSLVGIITMEARDNALRALEGVAYEIASRAESVAVEVRHGHPLGECRDVAERTRADLVVITRTQHEPGRHPLAEKVTRYLTVSVLVVPTD